jgi:hypothetical protein
MSEAKCDHDDNFKGSGYCTICQPGFKIEKSKPLSAEERAREIAMTVCSLLNFKPVSRQDADNFDACVEEIVAQICVAEEMAYKRGRFEECEWWATAADMVQRTLIECKYPGLAERIRALAGN